MSNSLRLAAGATLSRFEIAGVPGVEDRNRIAFDAVSAELRYRALDRATAPVGLTFIATPFFGFYDDISGAPADRYGASLVAAVDRALVPERLIAALNLTYALERSRDHASGLAADASTLGFDVAVTTRVYPWLYVGAEARYVRVYDGLALDSLAGQAVYLGPTVYAPIASGVSISAAWNMQAWGQANGQANGLDLTNFTQHQVKLRLEFDF